MKQQLQNAHVARLYQLSMNAELKENGITEEAKGFFRKWEHELETGRQTFFGSQLMKHHIQTR